MTESPNIDNPFFSIVLPTYNRAHQVGEAIKSVIEQDYANWELLVVDDGSTDDTKEVVLAFEDERIRYIYQENAERSAARNNGADQAKGQYICFIDSDDWYTPDHLSSFYKVVEENNFPVALFYCGYLLNDKDYYVNFEDGKMLEKSLFERILLDPVGMVRMCIHKDIMREIKLDTSLSISEDREFLTRVAKTNYPMIFSKQATYIIRPEDEDHIIGVKTFERNIEALNLILSNLDEKQVSKDTRSLLLGRAYYKLAESHYQHKNKKEAVTALKRSFQEKALYRNKERLYLLKQILMG